MTVSSTMAPSNQSSFPILICANGSSPCNTTVAALNQTGAGAHVQNSNGYDIGFFTDTGCSTKVTAWEVENYNASTGELEAWVNQGTVSSSVSEVFYMCYGDATISTFQSTASSVWDSNYKTVNHLGNTSSPATDSTTNTNSFTQHNGVTFGSAGQIDGAVSFAGGSSQYLDAGDPPSLHVAVNTDFTMSIWVKINGTSRIGLISSYGGGNPFNVLEAGLNGDGQPRFWTRDDNGNIDLVDKATNYDDNTWHYFVGRYIHGGNPSAILYVDGTAVANNGAVTTHNTGISTGQTWETGGINAATPSVGTVLTDELRVSIGIARAVDWITTEYNNQSAPATYVTFGSETPLVVAPPISQGLIQGGKVSIQGGKATIQ